MTAPPLLLLTRHGQTEWHHENRYAGAESDIDLTPAGVRQAERLAGWVRSRGVDAVVSSPVRRAVETAEPSALAAGVPLVVVDELREVTFGVAEGRTLAELDRVIVERFRADPAAHPFPGAEAPEAAAGRCAAALGRIAARHPAQTVLVVAHNTLLRLGLCALLGLPVAHYRRVFPRLDNVAVTEVVVPLDRTRPASLLCLNVPVLDTPVHSGPCSTTKELS